MSSRAGPVTMRPGTSPLNSVARSATRPILARPGPALLTPSLTLSGVGGIFDGACVSLSFTGEDLHRAGFPSPVRDKEGGDLFRFNVEADAVDRLVGLVALAQAANQHLFARVRQPCARFGLQGRPAGPFAIYRLADMLLRSHRA
jgi:hypothetical protein